MKKRMLKKAPFRYMLSVVSIAMGYGTIALNDGWCWFFIGMIFVLLGFDVLDDIYNEK